MSHDAHWHAHLVSQGWSGKGTALRHGAITRPITVVQKKTLSGIGKDRDEAFPFWDHVFEAAALNIQVKLHKDDDDSDEDSTSALTSTIALQRTSTGIISNRRPVTSGTATPDSQPGGSATPRLNIMAVAKQEAARRTLYSKFFRGPVIGCDDEEQVVEMETETVERVSEIMEVEADGTEYVSEVVEVQGKVTERKKTKKCKSGGEAGPSEDGHGKRKKKRKSEKDEDKQERKRRKREAKEEKAARDEGKTMVELPAIEESSEKDVEGILALSNAKAEKRRRKEERRARKEEKRKRKVYSLSEVTANGEGGVEEELPRPSHSSHTVVEADASRKQQKDKNKKSGTSDDLSSSMKSTKKRKKMPSE